MLAGPGRAAGSRQRWRNGRRWSYLIGPVRACLEGDQPCSWTNLGSARPVVAVFGFLCHECATRIV